MHVVISDYNDLFLVDQDDFHSDSDCCIHHKETESDSSHSIGSDIFGSSLIFIASSI